MKCLVIANIALILVTFSCASQIYPDGKNKLDSNGIEAANDLSDYEQEALSDLRSGPYRGNYGANEEPRKGGGNSMSQLEESYDNLIQLENEIQLPGHQSLLKIKGEAAFALGKDERFVNFERIVRASFENKKEARNALLSLCAKKGITFTLATWYDTEEGFAASNSTISKTRCFDRIYGGKE